MFAPHAPAKSRETSNTVSAVAPVNFEARAKITYEPTAPRVLNSRMGLRPTRSESRPQTGAKMNCMKE